MFSYQKKLAQQEGIFAEPAGAVALAGLVKAVELKEVKKEDKIVCLVTGSGFKDMLSVDNNFGLPSIEKVDLPELQTLLNQSR